MPSNFPKVHADAMAAAAADRSVPATNRWGTTFFHADAGAESAYTARQLEALRPGVIAQSFPEFTWSKMLPVNTQVSNGAEQITATFTTQSGEVLVSRDMKGIIPRSDMATDQSTLQFYSIMNSYGYTFQEARAAMMAGLPLQAAKATNAREQLERKLDDMMMVGDTATGMQGLLSITGVATYSIPTTGTGGSKLWVNKDADQVILDLASPAKAMAAATLGIEIPDTMVLPISARDDIGSRRVGDGTSVTILNYFLNNNPYIRGDNQIMVTPKSETLGSGSTRLGIVYKKDPSKLEAYVSQPFEQFAPQTVSMEVTTACHIRHAGVFCYRTQSVSSFFGF